MAQKTNLNINPYFDDFDPNKNFYKVLFKPGFPVQARELTTLQSIFQNQLESFGSHFFKEGSMVIPGSVTYDDQYFSVKINQDHLGLDVTLYIDNLIGKKITGQTSGIGAVIKNYSIPPQDNVDEITLYVKYLESGNNLGISQFSDGEILVVQDNVIYGNTVINSGDTIATVLDQNATFIGSSVGVDKGTYFIRGTFVNVEKSSIVLEPYSNKASYRVGFSIFEEIVTSDEDSSLNDNARGFPNYAAPGADRFKISVVLSKKDLNDFNDTNFIEIIKIQDGQIKKIQDKSSYSIIQDYLAQRTYEESGNYALKPFQIDILNSLNDGISNRGIYLSNQKTEQGNTPSDDLMCVKVSSGKAYVYGYDVTLPSATIIDVEKPRDTATVENALVPFQMGNLVKVNNVSGTPFVGLSTSNNTIELYNERKNSTSSGTGTLIGKARVYSFSLTDASYTNASSEWDLYLYDIQTFTVLNLNETLNSSQCPESSYVEGVSSGASGYVVVAPTTKKLTIIQASGSFIVGEQIAINGQFQNLRSIVEVIDYSVDDIKSVYQNSTSLTTQLKQDFVSDVVLSRVIPKGFNITDRLTINPPDITGISTVTCPGKTFLGIRSDSIITYQIPEFLNQTYNRVVSVSQDGFSMHLAAVPNISGICTGGLPSSLQSVSFSLATPNISGTGELYTNLPNKNISTVNLNNSTILISTQINELSTNSVGSLSVTVANTGISSAFFETFDAERYSIFYSDGAIEDLTSDQVSLSSNGTQINFVGLRPNQSNNVTLNATLRKRSTTHKIKNYIRSEKLNITKTLSGVSTSASGLSASPFYGTRIEDNKICLNVPDVVKVIAVYESLTDTAPTLDKLTFVSGLNLDTQSILGEKIIGNQSGSIAQLVTRTSSTEVEFVYLNSKQFISGESVTFEESQITSNIQTITIGSYLNITNRYGLNKGQKNQYYDYSFISRSRKSAPPSRQLLVIFDYYEIPSNDSGDLITVNSYTKERFTNDIPAVGGGVRSSDTLDFRPRVVKFTSTDKSPFAFDSKVFELPSSYFAITPNESSIIGYSYYLPRTDRLVLNKLGELSIIKGTSSPRAQVPLNVEEVMDIAFIRLPPYLYHPNQASITVVDNRRYTMRDIGDVVDRVHNLEVTTSLSLLELDTKTLQIQDSDGLTRFKSGFFVDNFNDTSLINSQNLQVNCDVDTASKQLIPPTDFWSLKAELALAPDINPETADFSSDLPLLDPNIKKTGDLITLNYTEIGWIEQPLASNVENINPFNVIVYAGGIVLNPSSDNWVRNIYIEDVRTVSRSYTNTIVTTTDTISNIETTPTINTTINTTVVSTPESNISPNKVDASTIKAINSAIQWASDKVYNDGIWVYDY